MPTSAPTEKLAEILHRVFGHTGFRPHQQEVCEAAAAGRDVLLVMPTGAGKSLCYQLPALALAQKNGGGTALVISPLIALMDDQATKLTALNLRVARIHSGMGRDASRQACRDYLDGTLDFLFIAPERMRVPGFPEMLAKRKPSLIAIDEAHCISAWGHDFRPDYRTLGQHLPALRPASIIALTATATPTVQRDILQQLSLQEPAVFITGFRRENLAVEVVELSKPQRPEFALKLLKEKSARPAILYAGSRKQAEELAQTLHKHFPTAAYHAGLDPQTRERVQRAFLGGKLDCVVATVAFGMGVDKADVRTVVHVALPGSVEAYYQEIGRAGRDGLPSRTVLLHGFADRRLQEFFLEKNYPPVSDLEQVAGVLTEEFQDVETLQRALGRKKIAMGREDLDRAIEKLQGVGVAEVDMGGLVRAGDGVRGVAAWKSGYDAQVEARRAQIDRMVAFAESTECRMRLLVEHFGDTSDKARSCGLCDVCNPSGSGSANAAHQPDTEERGWLRTILRALEGRSTSTGKLFTELKLMKDRSEFDTLLDALARAGLITIANDTFRSSEGKEITYKKATITHEGRDPDEKTLDTVWIRGSVSGGGKKRSAKKASGAKVRPMAGRSTDGWKSVPFQASSPRVERQGTLAGVSASAVPAKPKAVAPAVAAVELTEGQRVVEERLKHWRRAEAALAGLPSFFVFSDTVLRNIVLAGPMSLAELQQVKGVGPDKVERFGAKVVELCRG
jgi:ATP-dependent DNA helicase RecQ